jgi:hypothetical protein
MTMLRPPIKDYVRITQRFQEAARRGVCYAVLTEQYLMQYNQY